MTDEELKARIYALPTREELERIFSQFVTKEVFSLEIDRLRQDIKDLQDKPANGRSKLLWIVTVTSLVVAILGGIFGFVSQHFVWK